MKYLAFTLLFMSQLSFAQTRYVISEDLNFRVAPGLNTIVTNVLEYKDSLIEISNQGRWTNVIWNLDTGWVYTEYTADENEILEFFEVETKSGAVCNDGTIQRKISTTTVCKYNGGVKKWLYTTYVYRNGREQFKLD